VVSAAMAIGIWAASDWLATEWVTAHTIPTSVVANAFAMMGVVTALRFVESIYVTSIVGLQRQVLENVVTASTATARNLGAVAVLAWISPSVEAFFFWQGLISIVSVAVVARVVYGILPKSPKPAAFSWSTVIEIWQFAAGMIAINLLALLLTQLDKILLSRMLTLEAFGYYAFAGVVAGSLSMLIGPITTAFYPRFVELITRGDHAALPHVYHQSAQLVSVLVGGSAMMLALFADRILTLWTADAALASNVSPLLAVLSLGTLLNGLLWIPYQMQLAHGWTTLTIKANAIAVLIQVPAILWAVPKFGAVGAAWIWVVLNAAGLLVVSHLMFRRILRFERRRWYLEDMLAPLAAGLSVALLFRWSLPTNLSRLAELASLAGTFACVLGVASLASRLVRQKLHLILRRRAA